jgi:hypothetical protein
MSYSRECLKTIAMLVDKKLEAAFDIDESARQLFKLKCAMKKLVYAVDSLDKASWHLTFGKNCDFEAFERCNEVALECYEDLDELEVRIAYLSGSPFYSRQQREVELLLGDGRMGGWFTCQLEALDHLLRSRFFDQIGGAADEDGSIPVRWGSLRVPDHYIFCS